MLFIIPVYGIVKRCESVPLPPLEGAWAAWYGRRHAGMPPYSWYVRRWLVEIAAAQTPHQQSWMENSTHQGARTPGQGRQFKNSSIRRAARATSPQGEACVIAVRFVEILQESLLPTGGSEIRPYGCSADCRGR